MHEKVLIVPWWWQTQTEPWDDMIFSGMLTSLVHFRDETLDSGRAYSSHSIFSMST